MPLELARVGIQRHDGVAVEIVSGPRIAIEIRTGVARPPVGQVERRIVRSRGPHRPSTVLPRISRPGIVSCFAGFWNHVEAPDLFAGLRVIGRDETADAVLSARRADDHLVLHDQRRVGDRIALLGDRHGRVPLQFAGLGVDGDKVRIRGAQVQSVSQDREPAVDSSAARLRVGGGKVLVGPPHRAASRV